MRHLLWLPALLILCGWGSQDYNDRRSTLYETQGFQYQEKVRSDYWSNRDKADYVPKSDLRDLLCRWAATEYGHLDFKPVENVKGQWETQTFTDHTRVEFTGGLDFNLQGDSKLTITNLQENIYELKGSKPVHAAYGFGREQGEFSYAIIQYDRDSRQFTVLQTDMHDIRNTRGMTDRFNKRDGYVLPQGAWMTPKGGNPEKWV